MSCRTVIYKGLLLADQVGQYYLDLQDPRVVSALALVHQRFSTNTFPEWARAPVPDGRAQRRDQHRQGQLQLDARARGRDEVAGARRRPEEALPDQLRGPERHRDLRQRARAADDERLLARPRGDDDDPRGLGQRRRWTSAGARSTKYHAAMLRTLGRPGGDGLHRRPPDRRDARPQRPAPGALHRHRRRSRDGVRVRRAADPRVKNPSSKVAPAARQDVPDRPRPGPHRRRRGSSTASSPRPSPTGSGSRASASSSTRRRSRPRRRRSPRRCSTASRPSA